MPEAVTVKNNVSVCAYSTHSCIICPQRALIRESVRPDFGRGCHVNRGCPLTFFAVYGNVDSSARWQCAIC
ncbi:hypothetical protein P879_09866 [Paragonimus westermani]|uniref:Uncharacterized protein n=1 Tax=Paragonimus westermani TaxID=34504 RepID=A0A8T0D8J1_9TREM|nr:hypothetical protein P879_09866 [Paragonimus westermani]